MDMRLKQWAVIKFLTTEGCPLKDIHIRLKGYGDAVGDISNMWRWVKKFKSGETKTADKSRNGWPSTSELSMCWWSLLHKEETTERHFMPYRFIPITPDHTSFVTAQATCDKIWCLICHTALIWPLQISICLGLWRTAYVVPDSTKLGQGSIGCEVMAQRTTPTIFPNWFTLGINNSIRVLTVMVTMLKSRFMYGRLQATIYASLALICSLLKFW